MTIYERRKGEDRRSEEPVSRVVWWLLGSLATIIFAALTAFVNFTHTSIEQNRGDITNLKVIAGQQTIDLQYIKHSVDDINAKLDKRGKK